MHSAASLDAVRVPARPARSGSDSQHRDGHPGRVFAPSQATTDRKASWATCLSGVHMVCTSLVAQLPGRRTAQRSPAAIWARATRWASPSNAVMRGWTSDRRVPEADERTVQSGYCCNQTGVSSGEVHGDHSSHAVANDDRAIQAELSAYPRHIVAECRDVERADCFALAVAPHVQEDTPMAGREVFGLRGEVSVIACPPVYEHDWRVSGSMHLIEEFDTVSFDHRHVVLFLSGEDSTRTSAASVGDGDGDSVAWSPSPPTSTGVTPAALGRNSERL